MSRTQSALAIAGKNLHRAASNALTLLNLMGQAGARGDTVDDLRVALNAYEEATNEVIAAATSPSTAEPDQHALNVTLKALGITMKLEDVMKIPAMAIAVRRVAQKPTYRPIPGADFKRRAANDID